MATLKELTQHKERLAGGHRLCAGCGASVAVRQIMLAVGDAPAVTSCATCCLEVSTSIYPYTSWRDPYIHSAFENSAATMAGVEAAFKGLERAGRISSDKKVQFIAFGGDGGTYDIGLQALSGAMERGHDMVYVCYDNGAYMNTGIQRSSATPLGAWATTAEVGSVQQGKIERRKDLTSIIADHGVPFVGQASISHWKDLTAKAEKAFAANGPAFLNVFTPCPRGWRTEPGDTIAIAKLAVQTGFWPCFEIENGVWRETVKVANRKPIEEFLRPQGRFAHLFRPENAALLKAVQDEVDRYLGYLDSRYAASAPASE